MQREKILKLMSFVLTPFDQAITRIIDDWKQKFSQGFGDLTQKEIDAVSAIEVALRASAGATHDRLADVYATNFTEEEVDKQIDFWEGIGKRLAEVTPTILEATNQILLDWHNAAIKAAEPQLAAILGGDLAGVQPNEIPVGDAPPTVD